MEEGEAQRREWVGDVLELSLHHQTLRGGWWLWWRRKDKDREAGVVAQVYGLKGRLGRVEAEAECCTGIEPPRFKLHVVCWGLRKWRKAVGCRTGTCLVWRGEGATWGGSR